MTTLKQIFDELDQYLFMPDKDIIKLICGFCLTCKMPIPPLWLFIASGSSAGKTAIISLYEGVPGFSQVDNMTANSLQSGMKRTDKSASFLSRFPKNGFIVFKDFTVMMSKNPEALAEIMGQLRVVYDGSSVRLTGGQIEQQKWENKVSMLGAGTAVLYTKNDQFSDMGQRMIIYNFEQADDYAVSKFKYEHKRDDRTAIKAKITAMIAEYVNSIIVSDKFADLPDIDRETWDDLTHIAHLATTARSPIERDKYSRTKAVLNTGFKEAFTRLFDEVLAAAYGLMLQNEDKLLNNNDRKILFKCGLDCIDPKRRKVLRALTQFNFGGGTQELADVTKLGKDVAEIAAEDLVILDMVDRTRVPWHGGYKTVYKIKDKYKDIMARFDNIVPEDKPMPAETVTAEPLPEEPGAPISEAEQQLIREVGI